MSRLRIVIQRIEDDTQPERVTELDRLDVPHLDARYLHKETALDHLEAQTLAQGHEVMRHLLLRQWEGVEEQLVANYQELFSPQAGQEGRRRSAQAGQPGGAPGASPPRAGTHRRRRTRHSGE
jgi:hypothetical protein